MELLSRAPLWVTAAMLALVAVATGNLSGLGIGAGPLFYDNVALPRLVIALVLTPAAWTLWFARAVRDSEPVRVDVVWVLLGGLAFWAGLSAAFSPHRVLAIFGQSERLEGVVMIALYALLYGLALQVVRSAGDARIIVTSLAAAAGLLGFYGLAQYAGFDPTRYLFEGLDFRGRAFATFANPNFLAGFLVLALPLPPALALCAKGRSVRIVWTLVSLAVGGALFATFTRGAWIAALVQLVLWVTIRRRLSIGASAQTMRVLVGLGLAVFAALFAVSLTAPGDLNVIVRITDAVSGVGSVSERAQLVPIAWDAALERPLTGYGPDAFLAAFRLHRSDEYMYAFGARRTMNNAHSWPLQYAVTLGLPGALLLGLIIGVGLWRGRRVTFAMKSEYEHRRGAGEVLMAAAWVSCVGFAAHMLFSVAVPGSVVPFWALLGLAGAPHATSIRLKRPIAQTGTVVAVLLTLSALTISAALISADASYRASRNVFQGFYPGDATELAVVARKRNPFSVKYARGAAETSAAVAISAIEAGDSEERVRLLYKTALEEFDYLLRQSPNDYAGLAWLASLETRTGLYLNDQMLINQGQATARRAAELDRQGEEVLGLALGDPSTANIESAAGVWPLP